MAKLYISRKAAMLALMCEADTHLNPVKRAYTRAAAIIEQIPVEDVQPVKRWISVNDRLPDDCVEVLVYDTDCGILIGWYDKKDSIFVAEFINQLDAVTHWMPLPKPPQD